MTENNYQLDKEVDLDTKLDDIPELPGYTQLHSGSYVVVLADGIELKEVKDSNYFGVNLVVKEIGELSEKLEEGEKGPQVGDIQSFLFDRSHAVAMSNFKKFIAAPIGQAFGLKTTREVIEASRGIEMVISGKRKYNKEKDQYNFNLVKSFVVT
ncbi:unnamed protein product [Sphagnum jensenii]